MSYYNSNKEKQRNFSSLTSVRALSEPALRVLIYRFVNK